MMMRPEGYKRLFSFLLISLAVTSICLSSAQATSILFIGNGADPDASADGDVNTFLVDSFGADNVTYQRAGDTNPGDEAAFDVLVISSTPGSGDMRNKFHNSTTGIVNWEEAIVDCADGEFCLSAGRPKESGTHMVELTAAGHPIQGALPNGVIAFTSGDVELFYTTDNAVGVGEIGHKDGDSGLSFLTYADVGDVLLGDGTAGKPATAAGRRVTFPMTDSTFSLVTTEGQTLFANAVEWAAVPEPSSVVSGVMGLIGLLAVCSRRRK